MAGNQLTSVQHIVQLMLENRSFDHMLGFLYPAGQAFEGLTGSESNTDASGNTVTVYKIDPTAAGAYFMPGADPGEGYANTNAQLFGTGNPPSPPVATNAGFVTNYADAISYDQRSEAQRAGLDDRLADYGDVHSCGPARALWPRRWLCGLRPLV